MSEYATVQKSLEQKKTQISKKEIDTKTYTIEMKKQETSEAFDKMLRRPRSKKKMKLYASVDLPSLKDEEIMEQMQKEQNIESIKEISRENIAAYLESCQQEFAEMIQNEIEEERIQEEKRKLEEKERLAKKKIGVLTSCAIKGCYVHFVPASGSQWNNVQHYSRIQIPDRFQEAVHLYEEFGKKCAMVEIYGNRMVAVASSGEVLKIQETSQIQAEEG